MPVDESTGATLEVAVETVSFPLGDAEHSPAVLVEIEASELEGLDQLERAGLSDWGARRAKVTFDQALSAIPLVARSVQQQIEELDAPPNEVELTFGLKFTGTTSVKIVQAQAESHLCLTLRWKTER